MKPFLRGLRVRIYWDRFFNVGICQAIDQATGRHYTIGYYRP